MEISVFLVLRRPPGFDGRRAASIVGVKRGQAEDKDVPIEKIASESYIEPRFRS